MSAYIVDTETTGEEPVPEVIELAVAKLHTNLDFEPYFQGFFKPERPIWFSAMAVHNILPSELEGHPASALAKAHLPADLEYMIGHNVDYDWKALGEPACKRICTLALSRWVWPGNRGHSIGALTYALHTDLANARDVLKHAHSAGDDVELCYAILRALLEQEPLKNYTTFEQLYQASEIARIPVYWTFGKFRDKRIEEADAGYLQWCLRQADMDEYVKLACRRALAPRSV